MNIEEINKCDCCGCTACVFSCPKDAIRMKTDDEGFLYPVIDEQLCVDCGMCLQVCNRKHTIKITTIGAYAAKNRNSDILKKSSSGGVSHGLCKEITSRNGVVYGVVYDDKNNVVIERKERLQDCDALFGSKYVQANPQSSFVNVSSDLLNGKVVLYFGTSCIIAGLLSFLSSKKVCTDRLYTVDLVCHGVPSPLLFQDYIKWLDKHGELKKYDFRTKKKPWGYGSRNFGCMITYNNGKEEVDTVKTRVFLNLFFSNNCLRPHCHQCEFCGIEKPSDITIADFWGCDLQEPDFFSEEGVSAVLVHTEKGEQLLLSADELNIKETTVEKICIKQGNLTHPSPVSKDRENFWQLYNEKGFMAVAKKYGSYTLKQKLKYLYLRMLSKKV